MFFHSSAKAAAARTRHLRAVLAGATVLSGVLGASAAFAQSTGSQTVEQVVVTAHQPPIAGLGATQVAPKTKATVSQEYISLQATGANALSDLNIIPGVNMTNDDPYGMSGGSGHFSIRGIKAALIAEQVDGVPLNDGGNYAIYPGELVDPEVIDSVSVITGSSDVDSPSSSSLGGLVNINTITPTKGVGGLMTASVGSLHYERIAGVFNTGEIGPFGTRAWVEGSDQSNEKYTRVGKDKKWQINAKAYQDLHHDGDFIAVAGFYDEQIADLYDGVDFANSANPATTSGYNFKGLLSNPWNYDYSTSPSAGTNYYQYHQNPTYTGNIRGESRFTLAPNLKLTVDPSYQWVLANGGGYTTISQSDPRLIGNKIATSVSNFPACYTNGVVSGLDLTGATSATGAPVCSGKVPMLNPSNTQTNRITLNSSLIWEPIHGQVLQFSYAYDSAKVRQTGEDGLISPTTAQPDSIWGALSGWGSQPIIAADGTTLDKRNRLTVAELNQFSAEYVGKFLDDRLRLDLGVRAPDLTRTLHQYCYTLPPSTVACSNSQGAYYEALGYVAPFTINTSYTKALPNVGATWKLDDVQSIFADYTSALNAPVNDDLYSIAVVGSGTSVTSVGKDTVQPETSDTYEAGYRYQTGKIKASFSLYSMEDRNHIVTSYNQQTGDSVDQNVGSIHYYGAEFYAVAHAMPNLDLTGSVSYNKSKVQSNIPETSTYVLPTEGKEAVDSPELMVAADAIYTIGDFKFSLFGKYVGSRWVTFINDLEVPSYVTFDATVRYDLTRVLELQNVSKRTYIQLNINNIFNERYLGSINTGTTNNPSNLAYAGQLYATQGTPQIFQIQLRVDF